MCNAKKELKKKKISNLMFFFCYILFDFSFLRVHTKVAKITCNPHKLLLHVLNSVLLSRLGSLFLLFLLDFSTIFLLLLFLVCVLCSACNQTVNKRRKKGTTKVICQIIRDIKRDFWTDFGWGIINSYLIYLLPTMRSKRFSNTFTFCQSCLFYRIKLCVWINSKDANADVWLFNQHTSVCI